MTLQPTNMDQLELTIPREILSLTKEPIHAQVLLLSNPINPEWDEPGPVARVFDIPDPKGNQTPSHTDVPAYKAFGNENNDTLRRINYLSDIILTSPENNEPLA